jgi:hypothetical protein
MVATPLGVAPISGVAKRSRPLLGVFNGFHCTYQLFFFIIRKEYQRAGKLNQVNDLRGFRSRSITLGSRSITLGLGQVLENTERLVLTKYHTGKALIDRVIHRFGGNSMRW